MREAGKSWGEIAKVAVSLIQPIFLSVLTISQSFPSRTEGSVKKHWYKVSCLRPNPTWRVLTPVKDMHYADFAEDEVRLTGRKFGCRLPKRQSQALLNAIKEYEANKWKEIGRRVGKPAKVSL